MLLENSLKKFKETSEEFKKMFGLIGLTIIIIFSFMILNIFFGATDKLKGLEKQADKCAIEMQKKLEELNAQWLYLKHI